ncbi:hypothetical protein [Streptomyces stackebrandtii]|uniref:hypothetical protein n=1 Tax=Streptomyces stackebrandtii TaxID=3051177 RepID=UPI0028DBA4CD|nr:hypothetical protein [Streptomyces sp. DSM 40976]
MKKIVSVVALVLASGALAAPANAVPDPVGTVTCVTESAGDVTSLVDPASPGVLSEVPGEGCP